MARHLMLRHVMLPLASVFLIALVWFTRPLWLATAQFPGVPFVRGLSAAVVVQQSLTGAAVLSLLGLVLFSSRQHLRLGFTLIAVCVMISLVLLNQHRLQPWLIHFLVIITLLATCPDDLAAAAIRIVTAGVYFHSAVSKLDYDFLTGGGFYLVKALGSAVGVSCGDWPQSAQIALTCGLPIFELVVALCLLTRFSQWGWMLAVVMHTGLIAALLQLNHKPGVLIWNFWFIVQALLFVFHGRKSAQPNTSTNTTNWRNLRHNPVANTAVVITCLLPFLNYEPLHIWDNWPSWSLYSTRSERVSVFVHENARRHLPDTIQKFVGAPSPFVCRVKIDRWSLEETNAPIYPEDRFQLGVALQIANRLDLARISEPAIIVRIESPAARFSGKRTVTELVGTDQLRKHVSRFRLNATPNAIPIPTKP